MISELFLSDLLLIKTNGTYDDQNDFFAALYRKQEAWARREPLGAIFALRGKYTPDRNLGNLKVYNVPESSWVEYQKFVDDAFVISGFLQLWVANLSASYLAEYLTRAGLASKPSTTTTLFASNGTLLASGLTTPALYEAAWNSLRVPYERGTLKDLDFPYVKFVATILTPGTISGAANADYFRFNTLKFDGTA